MVKFRCSITMQRNHIMSSKLIKFCMQGLHVLLSSVNLLRVEVGLFEVALSICALYTWSVWSYRFKLGYRTKIIAHPVKNKNIPLLNLVNTCTVGNKFKESDFKGSNVKYKGNFNNNFIALNFNFYHNGLNWKPIGFQLEILLVHCPLLRLS
jgi:hypothetical protein